MRFDKKHVINEISPVIYTLYGTSKDLHYKYSVKIRNEKMWNNKTKAKEN